MVLIFVLLKMINKGKKLKRNSINYNFSFIRNIFFLYFLFSLFVTQRGTKKLLVLYSPFKARQEAPHL